MGRLYSHLHDEIRVTSSGSCTFSSEAKGMCFLRLVMGDISMCARHMSDTPSVIKLQSLKNTHSCLFGGGFGGVRFGGFFCGCGCFGSLP